MFQPIGVILRLIKFETYTYRIPWYYSKLVLKYMLKMVKIQVKIIVVSTWIYNLHVDLCCIHVTGVNVPYRNGMILWSWMPFI